MKKITITVDETTLAHLELLRYYFSSNNSAIIRRAIDDFEESIRGTGGYDRAVRLFFKNNSDESVIKSISDEFGSV